MMVSRNCHELLRQDDDAVLPTSFIIYVLLYIKLACPQPTAGNGAVICQLLHPVLASCCTQYLRAVQARAATMSFD